MEQQCPDLEVKGPQSSSGLQAGSNLSLVSLDKGSPNLRDCLWPIGLQTRKRWGLEGSSGKGLSGEERCPYSGFRAALLTLSLGQVWLDWVGTTVLSTDLEETGSGW